MFVRNIGAPGVLHVPYKDTRAIGQDFDMSTWHAVFAPKGTSPDILDFLNQDIKVAMAKDSVQKSAIDPGFKPYPYMSRKDVSAFATADASRWKRFIEIAGVERQ